MTRRLLAVAIGIALLVALAGCSQPASTPTPTPPKAATTASKEPAATAAVATPTVAAKAPTAAAKDTPKPAAAAPTAAGPKEKIKFMLPTEAASHMLAYAAKDWGYFDKEGLDVDIAALRAPLMVPGLEQGDVDYAFIVGSPLRAAVKGEPIRITMVTKSRPDWVLYLAPGLTSPEQMKGKAVGVSSGGTASYATKMAIAKLGLDPEKDVTYVIFPSDDAQIAGLKAGSVAAASLTPPNTNMAAAAGMKKLIDTADILEVPTGGVSTTLKKVQEKPGQVKGVLRALLKTMQEARANPNKLVDLIQKKFSLQDEEAKQIVKDEMARMPQDGTLSQQGIATQVNAIRAEGPEFANVTLEQINQAIDFTLLREVHKELGIGR